MRTLDPILKNALANQQGKLILRVNTWADATAYNAAPTVPENVWVVKDFDIYSTSAKATLITANDYTVSDFTVFIIERGVEVNSVEYTVKSGLMFVRNYKETFGYIYLEGSSYPNLKISIAGDATYQTVITNFCTAIGKTAVFKLSTDPWLSYQFLPTGKTLSLNKAELFENLIKQKYTILVYEESPNNLVFYTQDSYVNPNFTSITWSPELTLFCAVSSGGTSRIMTSPDGITWTARTAPELNSWNSITWSPALSLFCAVAHSGTYRVMTSADGITWASQTAAAAISWISVTWSPSLALFCAVAGDGTNRVMTSPDGITWTPRTAAENNFWRSVTWSPSLALFCAVAGDGTNRVMTSPDGITWTSRINSQLNSWVSVTWSPELALFCAIANDNTNRVMTSPDGITWTSQQGISSFKLSYTDGTNSYIIRDSSEVHYIWRDENATLVTSGDTTKPQWNLGFIDSSGEAPTTLSDPYYKIFLQKAPVRLDITDSDRINFFPYWSIDPNQTIDAMMQVSEHLDLSKSPSWYQEIKSIIMFNSTEGGALPSTIERVAAYTPLVSTGFDGNLTPSVNNLQALAQAVDDLDIFVNQRVLSSNLTLSAGECLVLVDYLDVGTYLLTCNGDAIVKV